MLVHKRQPKAQLARLFNQRALHGRGGAAYVREQLRTPLSQHARFAGATVKLRE